MPIVIQRQVNPSTSTVEESVDNPFPEFVDSSNCLINKKQILCLIIFQEK